MRLEKGAVVVVFVDDDAPNFRGPLYVVRTLTPLGVTWLLWDSIKRIV